MKLVTWNTQWCCGLDGQVSPQRIVDGALALAGAGGFDVLCLQEIAQGYDQLPGGPGDQPAELAALLPGYQIFFGAAVDEFVPDAHGQLHRRRFGNLIATRWPVRWVEHHRLPWPADASVASMPRACVSVTLDAPNIGALRVMTTHLEYYAPGQRMAQAKALRALHAEACARAAAPPAPSTMDLPFFAKPQTSQAILCGDFNFEPSDAEYGAIQQADDASHQWHDAWRLLRGDAPHEPTFRLFDRSYGPEPISCDFCFVDRSLAPRLQDIRVDGHTRVSDHQPVCLVLG